MDFNKLGDNGLLTMLALHRMAQMARENNGDDDDGIRIREIPDDDQNTTTPRGPSNSASVTSSIEQLFHLDEKSSAYLQERKYEEAYGLVKKQYKLGSKFNFAPVLVKYYVSLIHTDRLDKAAKIRDELTSLIQELLESSPEELEKYGHSLRQKSKFIEAILFYQISHRFCETEMNPADAVSALQGCALGTKLAVTELLEKHKVSKQTVRKHVIPEMHKFIDCLGRFKSVEKKLICIVQGLCLHHVEHCEFLVGDVNAREASIKRAITSMKDVLGSEAEKHHLYGGHLNNLGHTYLVKDRPGDAASYFSQAIVAKKRAEDYDTQAEKLEDIKKSELALQLARRQL
ncbi:unnamed protein product [Clavelina lepadiformis]|uniref:Uncharacterized protein n=1 Tax=Clavelina lepadiformis TaxID=159417 RepID=A0ABP0GEU8_CLALP